MIDLKAISLFCWLFDLQLSSFFSCYQIIWHMWNADLTPCEGRNSKVNSSRASPLFLASLVLGTQTSEPAQRLPQLPATFWNSTFSEMYKYTIVFFCILGKNLGLLKNSTTVHEPCLFQHLSVWFLNAPCHKMKLNFISFILVSLVNNGSCSAYI